MDGGGDDKVISTTGGMPADTGLGDQNLSQGSDPAYQGDNLNFGWFSMPRDGKTGDPQQGRPTSRSASRPGTGQQGGRMTNRPPSQSGGGAYRNSRPPSQSGGSRRGSRPPSQSGRGWGVQGRPPSNCGRGLPGPPQSMGYDPAYNCGPGQMQNGQDGYQNGDERLVISDDPDLADFERQNAAQGQGYCQQGYQAGGQHCDQQEGGEIVDWPMSQAFQEMMARRQRPPAEPCFNFQEKSRPPARDVVPAAPPTPMPPLEWDGYGSGVRPTYASWREQWHRAQAHPGYRPCRGRHGPRADHNIFGFDLNNNCVAYDDEDSDGFSNFDNDEESNVGTGDEVNNVEDSTTYDSNNNCNNNCNNNSNENNNKQTFDLRRSVLLENHKTFLTDGITKNLSAVCSPCGEIVSISRVDSPWLCTDIDLDDEQQEVKPEVKGKNKRALRRRNKSRLGTVGPCGNSLTAGADDNYDAVTAEHSKRVSKRLSISTKVTSRLQMVREKMACWKKKMQHRTSKRVNYSHFDNDLF